jgi:hypothetical protein
MRKRAGVAALFAFVVLLQLASTEAAWAAKPAPVKAPPPPPPPPPSPVAQALAAAKIFAASAAAKLPSQARVQKELAKVVAGGQSAARASVVLLSKAAATAYKATAATVVRSSWRASTAGRSGRSVSVQRAQPPLVPSRWLTALFQAALSAQLRQSKFSAPANTLSARLVAAVQKPLVSQPLALFFLFAAFAYCLRTRSSGAKLYARAAFCTAAVNWLTFSFLVHCVTTAVVFVLTVLDLLAANPVAVLSLAAVANASELRRLRSYLPALPARRKTASFATPPETMAVPRSAAPSPAPSATPPAARISASGATDAAKKPGTPVPGAPKTSPAARPAAK